MNVFIWSLGQVAMTMLLAVAVIFALGEPAAVLGLLVSYLVATVVLAEVTKPWA